MTMTGDESLAAAWAAAQLSVAEARRAPLSARHALRAAVALDALSDRAYARRAILTIPALARAGDILSFRAALRAADPALAPLVDLVACGEGGPRLQVAAVEVAPEGFARLPVGDLMVSLYNAGTIPRLDLVRPDGASLPMQDLLGQATDWWRTTLADVLLADACPPHDWGATRTAW